jgi:hypothetical protein
MKKFQPANEKARHAIVRGPVLLLFGGLGRVQRFFFCGAGGVKKGYFCLFLCSHVPMVVPQGVPNSTSPQFCPIGCMNFLKLLITIFGLG